MKPLTTVKLSGLFLILGLSACTGNKPAAFRTFCNPLDLSYRFCIDEPSRREAADPTVVVYKDSYLLFASKSGGYWYSNDLADWTFVPSNDIPTEDYAPTVVNINDTLYFVASSHEINPVFCSSDPLSGKWEKVADSLDVPVWDPALFLDDDGRVYLYWGCSNQLPLYGVEVDYRNKFTFTGDPVELKHADPAALGWEVPGDYNTLVNQAPWIEGSWMNKFNGTYYLQYAGPGTEFKSYSDAVYTSDHPLGPYSLQAFNPFAYKPGGYSTGAGHGSTFTDRYGNNWHMGTSTISVKHIFERRLGLFPTFIDEDGTLYSVTKYGDYPMIIPDRKISGFEEIFPGWMLLSYRKEVEVSSFIDSLPSSNTTDEDLRTYWSAKTGNEGEYARIDLGNECHVFAVQLNFAEHETHLFGRQTGLRHRFMLECSANGKDWEILEDYSNNETDNTHLYFQLKEPVYCRYLKVTNIEVPDGTFAMSGFRVFGNGPGDPPAVVEHLISSRDTLDRRRVHLNWNASPEADGYVISFGNDSEHLYHSYMVYSDTNLTMNSLNVNQEYVFEIEAFNGNGIGK